MGISLDQYRGAIGLFNCIKHGRVHVSNQPLCFATLLSVFNCIALVILLVLILSNDIEINPGPMSPNLLKIGHCNIRGIWVNFHDLLIHLTTAYDIFCISETMLSSRVRCDSLKIKGYQEPVRKDRTQHGGGLLVYMYIEQRNIKATSRPWVIWHRDTLDRNKNQRYEILSM